MRQIDLFTTPGSLALEPELDLDAEGLMAWQQRVLQYQQQQRQQHSPGQTSLFNATTASALPELPDPLSLPPQHLQFWRWPEPPNQGAALYFVFDHSLGQGNELLLYLGETIQADRRWKGAHDCKDYLAAYGETLVRCQKRPQFSIRFWCDAPSDTRQRRRLEQQQIRHWLPPFNKECRQRWQTPFQNQQR